ncbi:Glycosyltransferase family 4 protein [Tenacibaculum sp. 190130A14a]
MDQMYLHGGAEKIVSLKINSLIEDFGYDVFLITNGQRNKKNVYTLSPKVNQLDLNINYTQGISFFHPVNLLKTIQHFFKLKSTFKKIDPDIIISVSQTPDQFFLPFIRKKTPKIKEFHSSGVSLNLGFLKRKLFNLYKKYTTLVLLNKDEQQYYPFPNTFIIPNFIDKREEELFTDYSNRDKVIIAAGRIAPVKQFDHLIEAWKLIFEKFPEWEIHIYGEGDDELKNQLQTIQSNYEIKNLYFKGAVSDLDQRMKKASLYAMTSSTECFPMVLLEAMSNGVPIISYDCPNGPRNIISSQKEGILVQGDNIKAFSQKLESIILQEEARGDLSIGAFETSKEFLKDKVMIKWVDLYKKLKKV